MADLKEEILVPQVALTGNLEEFRLALEEEIKSARIDAFKHTVPLKAGRRIAKAGKSYQYLFQLRDNLNLPDDAPGDLFIPSQKPVEISIVAVDGMSIILSSKTDLGDYIPEARLFSDLTFLLKKLIERIEELSLSVNVVGDRILKNSGLTGEIKHIDQKGSNLNESQYQALRSSLDRNITFIWGPPGTGKTKTIGTIGYQLFLNDRSLLMVSHTNIAIDQALLKIAELVDPQTLEEGKILRIGNPKIGTIVNNYPNLLLDKQVEKRSKELTQKLSLLREETEELKEFLISAMREKEIYEWFAIAKKDVDEIRLKQIKLNEKDDELIETRKNYGEMKKEKINWEKRKSDSLHAKENFSQIGKINLQINSLEIQQSQLSSKKRQILDELQKEEKTLNEINTNNWVVRMWRGLPSLENQSEVVRKLKLELRNLEEEHSIISNDLNDLESKRNNLKKKLEEYKTEYNDDPDIVIAKYREYTNEINSLLNYGISLRKHVDNIKNSLENDIRYKLSVISKLGFDFKCIL